jgi:hypothetical protein
MNESGIAFTDEELAFLRHVRFGQLPPAVRPEERTAATETDPRRDRPDPATNADQWALRLGPGNG